MRAFVLKISQFYLSIFMGKTLTLKERLMALLVFLLVGMVGGMSAFYLFYTFSPKSNSTTTTERVTEKQVYIEKSAVVDAAKVVAQHLVVFLNKDQLLSLIKKDGRLEADCFTGDIVCQKVGAVLTSDGLVISSTNLDEKDLANWVALDAEGNR